MSQPNRHSFCRFSGRGLEDKIPDARTIWLFREQLTRHELHKTRHAPRFKQNPRMAMAYRNLDRFDVEQQRAIKKQAREVLRGLN